MELAPYLWLCGLFLRKPISATVYIIKALNKKCQEILVTSVSLLVTKLHFSLGHASKIILFEFYFYMVQKLFYLVFIFKLILFQSYNPSVFKTCQTRKCQDMFCSFSMLVSINRCGQNFTLRSVNDFKGAPCRFFPKIKYRLVQK